VAASPEELSVTVVAAVVYRQGERAREVSLADPIELDDDEFVWIGLFEPGEQELRRLQSRFKLHPLAVEDALSAHQRPKVEVYGSELFVVARTAELHQDNILSGETHVFVGQRYVITVRHGSARAHSDLRAQLEAAPGLLQHGPDYVLHAVLDFIVDGYLPIVDAIEEQGIAMERRALQAFLTRADIAAVFHLRRELARFQRILDPMEEVCGRLERIDLPCIDAETRPYFRDVLDHVKRVASRVSALRDALSTVFELSNLLEQQRQGTITRQLAAWAAILAVPTAVAGIYGMNFDVMPELRWRYGYFAVLGVIVTLCAGLYVRFKRSGWL
jgi:magnesium transporter